MSSHTHTASTAHLTTMYLNSSDSEKRRSSSMSPMVGLRWSLKVAMVE